MKSVDEGPFPIAYWQKAENKQLKSLGMQGYDGKKRRSILWFDLVLIDFYSEWSGKLTVRWPKPERAWWRWVGKNKFEIASVEESLFVDRMPSWDQINLTWEQIKALPLSWRERLSQWRGIYLIIDTSTGKGYVGSACGTENILSRWLNYARTGHGGNKLLRDCSPQNMCFCILQLFSVDTGLDEVINIESRWKDRLHTRKFGLNSN